MKEAWMYGCGQCDHNVVLTDELEVKIYKIAIDQTKEPCEECQAAVDTNGQSLYVENNPSGPLDNNPVREAVNWLMDWCHCGDPEEITKAVYAFLLEVRDHQPTRFDYPLLGYLCDGLGWTDHGGSVPGWLSDKGKIVLARLEDAFNAPHA